MFEPNIVSKIWQTDLSPSYEKHENDANNTSIWQN